MPVTGKKWYRSKSIWAGIIATGAGVVSAIQGGGAWETVVLTSFGALSILLRTLTKEGILR